MNFDLHEKDKVISEKIKGLLDPESSEQLSQIENMPLHELQHFTAHWLKRLAAIGYLSLGVDEGKTSVALLAAQESFSTVSPCLFLSAELSVRVFGRLLATYGSPSHKADLVPRIKEGHLIGCLGTVESNMNIESGSFGTVGVQQSDGYHLSGTKSHVPNAPIADIIAIAGSCGGRLAFFLLQKEAKGLYINQRHKTLGFTGMTFSQVSLDDCLVPPIAVLGPFETLHPLHAIRFWEDQVYAAACLGLMQRAFETAANFAKIHQSGGKPIIFYQEVGFKLAEMLTLLQTARLLAYRAAWMAETDQKETNVLGRCAKVFCAESAERVCSSAIQILGASGNLLGNPAEEGYRNAKYLQVAGTSTEISRMKIAADVLESY